MMLRDDEIEPIRNEKKLEDVNQNFNELRKEAKRRQRAYEGITHLSETITTKRGEAHTAYATASRRHSMDDSPPAIYLESKKDEKDLTQELRDLERDAASFMNASLVDYEGEKDG